jgi:hypothetical protein
MPNQPQASVPQHVLDKLQAYQHEEMIWMDAIIRAEWPRWITYLAEKDGFMAHLLRVFVARFSGLEIVRGRNFASNTPKTGFRPGRGKKETIDSVTSTMYKHQTSCKEVVIAGGQKTRPHCSERCVVAKRTFPLGIQI